MKTTSFAVKASLLTSMLIAGQTFAQTLPDEINHPQYLKVYQNLEQVMNQKIADYEKLVEQKTEIEQTIVQMEADQAQLPARNNELRNLVSQKRAEVEKLNSEITGLEGVLGKVVEDLRRLDAMIAQLQRDLSEESSRTEVARSRRNQIAQDVARINARLQNEIREENQSVAMLNKLNAEVASAAQKKQELDRERSQLVRDAERFKTEVVVARNTVTQNNTSLNTKRVQLSDTETRLPGIRSELSGEQAKLAQLDVTLNPKKTQLNQLKAELGRLSPEIAKLQAENRTLAQKIESNQTRINSSNVATQIAKRDALEAEIASVKTKLQSNSDAVTALQAKAKPVLDEIEVLNGKLKVAQRERNQAEIARLRTEIERLYGTIVNERNEINRLNKENEQLTAAIAPKQKEINTLNASITSTQSTNAALQKEIDAARVTIASNEKIIAERSQANAGLAQQIAELEKEVNALEALRSPTAQKVATLSQQEAALSALVTTLKGDIQRLEAENQKLNSRITEMDKAIAELPQNLRRIEQHARQLDELVVQKRSEIDREQRLLARIRQDRIAIEVEMNRAQSVLDAANQDLSQSERLVANLRGRLNEETRNREALVRYNQDSIRKLENLRAQKDAANNDIAAANEEIKINEQDIATIAQELPKLRFDLGVITPKVTAAENTRNTAQKNVVDANTQYQNRLALYQNYLAQSQKLGEEKASIGTTDGTKAGSSDAKTKANKLASENASAEAKWEALRRGYVRGEVAGYATGFDIGMASTPDAVQGEADGKIAGARRAKDHANLVIKPELYLEELERRLKEDETVQKGLIAALVRQEVSNIQSMAIALEQSIPGLNQEEINEAAKIVSSLDTLIEQSEVEIKEVLSLRKKLAEAKNVYVAPGAGESAQKADCSAVYKNVKDFIDACKGSYVLRYQSLYNTAHADAFNRDYGTSFKGQIESVYESELARLYPVYLKEATSVGKAVGVTVGKKEVYQQSFARAENASYAGNLPNEVARVESEAVKLVQEHLNQNAALTLKGSAKLTTTTAYGISPGADLSLKMLIKNIGSEASSNNGLVRIKELSSNVLAERIEVPLFTVAARSHAELSVMNLRVNDNAVPGSKIIIAGEIVHPGNHYRSNRVEQFRVESEVKINPSIDAEVEYDTSPKVAVVIFGTLIKHNVGLTINPKFAGVDQGYEAVLEEIDTKYVELLNKPSISEVLNRGVAKRLSFTYRLSKAAKGKTIKLRLAVKNGDRLVYTQDLEIRPK